MLLLKFFPVSHVVLLIKPQILILVSKTYTVWLQSCLQLILTDFLLLEPQSSHAGTCSPQRPRRSLSRMLLSLPLIDQLLFPQGSFHNEGISQPAQFTSQPPHAIIQHLVS